MSCAVGTSHAASNKPCQDFALLQLGLNAGDTTLVVVAADGAGSSAHAEIGARLTAETLADLVGTYLAHGGKIGDLSKEVAGEWLQRVVAALADKSAASNAPLAEYACTLLAAIVGEEIAAFLQVGDGAIVVSTGEEDGWSYVFWPQHGEFANSTNFVVSDNAAEVLDFCVTPGRIDELAVFTDGLEDLLLLRQPPSVHEPFFAEMFRPVRASPAHGTDPALCDALTRYLSGPEICERTDDDKTLVLATRRPLVDQLGD